ncbi:hypothetical protein MKZ38_004674 [Zalerion maritima]|uniref:Ankyrin repeat protein n=1 Tax=Zalerion maritima TaxID=339359 RepID=A0AAD5RLA7_9PEZI|nr:hypothetical protein MKZ38_004674 [Zalerion maritima]
MKASGNDMADPLSIISIAFQATKVGWHIYQFFVDAPSAPANIRNAHDTITGLENTLHRVNDLLKHRPNPPPPERKNHDSIVTIVAQCGRALQSLDSQLPKIPEDTSGENILKKCRLQLKTVLSENSVSATLGRIDKWNQMLQICLSTLSIYSSWETRHSTEQTHVLVQELLQRQREADEFQADHPADGLLEDGAQSNLASLDPDFAAGIEAWRRSVREVVGSVVDFESVRVPPTTIPPTIAVAQSEEPASPTSSRRTDPPPIPVTDDQKSTTTMDSGVHMPSFDILEPGRSAAKPPQLLKHIMSSAQKSAQECIKMNLPQKAVEYHKKYMAHRQQLSPDSPLTFAERSEMEETLAEIYLCMGTAEGAAEATKIVHNLVEQEVGLPEAEQDAGRKARLYHRLSRILLDLGRPDSMDVAALYAERAFSDRLKLEPRQPGLVEESGKLWHQALLKIPSPDVAEGLNEYTVSELGFSVRPDLATTHHDLALEWCQKMGFDADGDGFRFDVCDSRLDSKVKGLSPLHAAVMEGDKDILTHMLGCAANLEIQQRKDFATPLLLACTLRDRDIVKLLLAKSAKADAIDQYDKTGLHRCQTERGGTEVAKLLLESESAGSLLLNAVDSNRETALVMAARMGNRSMVALLLERGASPDIVRPGGSTALISAVTAAMGKDRKRDIIQLLLQHGADPRKRDNSGNSAIDLANESIRTVMKKNGNGPSRRESMASTVTTSSYGSAGSRTSSGFGRIDTMSSRFSIRSGRSGSTVATTASPDSGGRSGSRWRFKRA